MSRRKSQYNSDSTATDLSTSHDEDEDEIEYVSSSSTIYDYEDMPRRRGRPRKVENLPTHPDVVKSPLNANYRPGINPDQLYVSYPSYNPHYQNFSASAVNEHNFLYNTENRKVPYNHLEAYATKGHPGGMGLVNPEYFPNKRPQQFYTQEIYMNPSMIEESYAYEEPKKAKKLEPAPSEKIKKRSSALIKKEKESAPTDSSSLEQESHQTDYEEDIHEKILDKNDEGQYLVKIRYRSYLHCEWIDEKELTQTKNGLIKVKRFKKKDPPYDPDFIKVDRVISMDKKEEGLFLLIKWKKLPYEMSTWEIKETVENLEGFSEELKKYEMRNKLRTMQMSLSWRPLKTDWKKFESSPDFKGFALRPYQLEGLNWFLNRWYNKQGCIMADEMGLGKTVQSVSFISSISSVHGYNAPTIIVAPLSTIIHWEREFNNWTDLRVLVYHGSLQGREIIQDYEFYSSNNLLLFDVLITTYEMVMSGHKVLTEIEWGVAIFDEAHRLKNANSKASTMLRQLSISHKILLSGTPLQNNLQELWALLNFIDPLRYESCSNFLEEYKLEKSEDVERLQNILRPLMLRRMKDDVETLPVKEETIVEVELTMIQKQFYRAILEKNIEFLTKSTDSAPNLLNAMMELRKCCIHPYLIKGGEEKILGDYIRKKERLEYLNKMKREEGIEDPRESVYGEYNKLVPNQIIGEELKSLITVQLYSHQVQMNLDEYYKVLIESSGKLVLLDKLLTKLRGEHKVLIFSQMTKCLDLLGNYLTYRKYKYERIDGGVRGESRQEAIDRFSDSNSDIFVFLLCTRAGGVGINLTAADTVVIFDSDWNPQNDLQAQARCHRIGQEKEVKIYRLITRNTYEREMFDKAGLKLGLDRAVLQKMNYEGNQKVKKGEAIDYLLKKGAYGVLMENDEAAERFCEENIDQILEGRSQVVKHNDGGNVFSRAQFKIDEEVDDPDFWTNILSKRRVEEDEQKVKRQVRRLSRDGNLSEEERKEIEDEIKKIKGTRTTGSKENEGADEMKISTELTGSKLEFLVFLTAILRGEPGVTTLDENAPVILKKIVHHCFKFIDSKVKGDFMFKVLDEVSSENVEDHPFYKKYAEKFILRIQAPRILSYLLKFNPQDLKEDDKRLINWTINNGYDNYPATTGTNKGPFKGKNPSDLNQRVRKNILVLNRREEEVQDYETTRTLLIFGRVVNENRSEVERYLKEEVRAGEVDLLIEKMDEELSRLEKKRRKGTVEEEELKRRVKILDEIRRRREQGTMVYSRGRMGEREKEIVELVMKRGMVKDVKEQINMEEERIIKRMEMMIKEEE